MGRAGRRKSSTRRRGPHPINRIAKDESEFRKRFTSSSSGNLALAIRDGQAYLAGLVGDHAVNVADPDSDVQKALLALASTCFQLSRTAYLTAASGYPLQALPAIRALYERVAMVLQVRADATLAKKVVERTLRNTDLPKYATVARCEFEEAFDEYLRRRSGLPEVSLPLEQLRDQVAQLYGLLSDYTHPKRDAVPQQFLVNPATDKGLFALGPAESLQVYAKPTMAVHWFLLFMLQTILFVEFWDEQSDSWRQLAVQWEASIFSFSKQLAAQLQDVLEDLSGQ